MTSLLSLLGSIGVIATTTAAATATPVATQVHPDTGRLLPKATTVVASAAHPDPDGAQVTPAMIEAGRTIFHGQGGCFACHGTDMQGSAVAPPLNKQGKPWVAATGGTYAAIFRIVTHGVPGTLMIAHPNGISDALATQVAAYIWAVNHEGVKP